MIELEYLGEDDHGPFAQIRVMLKEAEKVVRWGLDNYTFLSLKSCLIRFRVQSSPYQAKPYQGDKLSEISLRLSTEYKWDPLERQFVSSISQISGLQSEFQEHFPCSNTYVSNLQWLKNVSSIDEFGDGAQFESVSTNQCSIKQFEDVERTVLKSNSTNTIRYTMIATVGSLCLAGILSGIYLWNASRNTVSATSAATAKKSVNTTPSTPGTKTANHLKSTNGHVVPGIASSSNKSEAPSPAASGNMISSVPKGKVALTFGGGPSPYTLQILRILKQYHVHATFFFVGDRISHWQESVTAVAKAGDKIGDQSMSRPLMSKLSPPQQERQIVNTRQIIEKVSHQPVSLFQPPYESYSPLTSKLVSQADMRLALWNRDVRDWSANSPSSIIQRINHSNSSGGVYTLNELPNTVKALPRIIQELKKQHLKFVTLS